MKYVLMDSTGNLIESYDSEDDARAALEQIVAREPEAADDVALIVYDDSGMPTGPAITLDASSVPTVLGGAGPD